MRRKPSKPWSISTARTSTTLRVNCAQNVPHSSNTPRCAWINVPSKRRRQRAPTAQSTVTNPRNAKKQRKSCDTRVHECSRAIQFSLCITFGTDERNPRHSPKNQQSPPRLLACFSQELLCIANRNSIKHQRKRDSDYCAQSDGYEWVYRGESWNKACHNACKNMEEQRGEHR